VFRLTPLPREAVAFVQEAFVPEALHIEAAPRIVGASPIGAALHIGAASRIAEVHIAAVITVAASAPQPWELLPSERR
jgi:hypothetical protein